MPSNSGFKITSFLEVGLDWLSPSPVLKPAGLSPGFPLPGVDSPLPACSWTPERGLAERSQPFHCLVGFVIVDDATT